jgi:cation transport ATPase
MSFCPKCGNKVDETMAFCPRCGASLKGVPSGPTVPPPQPYPRDEKREKNEKNEKQEKHESREKQEKGERGFVGYLIGGLILIIIGLFSVLQISNPGVLGAQSWALMLLIIGIIIIIGAIYVAMTARRRSPAPT